jgi:hypothetical protein
MGKSEIRFSIKEITAALRERQLNQYDANIGVSGARGDGKSTFLFKIFNSFKKDGFRNRKHQVYSQDDVKNLLANQKFGYCWDDEAINSGYKRDFQKVGQNELIKVVTNYRDNYNIYGSALPFFYSLDKALRELIFMHVHIAERGLGVMLLPLEGQIHSQDPWDTITNKKIETKENERLKRSSRVRFRYHKFTTFAGYIYFGPMSKKQEEKYKRIKEEKRGKVFESLQEKGKPKNFMEKLYGLLIEGKLTKNKMETACLMEGKKYSVALSTLNMMLKNDGEPRTVTDFIKKEAEKSNSNLHPQISNLVPNFSE